jgi:hypothetical protein
VALSFQCPECSAKLVLSSARPGHDTQCTSCGAAIVVPFEAGTLTPEELRQASGGEDADRDYEEEELPEAIRRRRFNFGAFLMTPIWLLLHGRIWTGVLLILLHIVTNVTATVAPPAGFLGFLLSIALSVYFGLRGYRIAWRDRGYYDTVEDVKRRERKWAVLGIAVAIIFWTLQILVAL